MRVAIVDDSRLARKELTFMLQDYNSVEVIWEAEDVDSAIARINEDMPDVLFLDIHMPGKNGFDLLNELDRTPNVVFTTAYDEYAVKALEYNALDYLMKPIKDNRLAAALEKIELNISSRPSVKGRLTANDSVFVKDGDNCWFVKLNEIRLFEVEGNYSRIYFEDKKPFIPKGLNYLESRLDESTFFRANRQQIINLKMIDKVVPWFSGTLKVIMLSGAEEVELSRRQSVKFKDIMSF
jgi:two-component system LytT family response regulator